MGSAPLPGVFRVVSEVISVESECRPAKWRRSYARPWVQSERGVLLLDQGFKLIGYNREAEAILTYPENKLLSHRAKVRVPQELLDGLKNWDPLESPPGTLSFHAGQREYNCWFSVLHCAPRSMGKSIYVLFLQRGSFYAEMVERISGKFGLTDRERQVLIGVFRGLSSKELADRLSISPNTVKTYLRLIMMKMGVNTRGAILAKVLADSGLHAFDSEIQDEFVAASAVMGK